MIKGIVAHMMISTGMLGTLRILREKTQVITGLVEDTMDGCSIIQGEDKIVAVHVVGEHMVIINKDEDHGGEQIKW